MKELDLDNAFNNLSQFFSKACYKCGQKLRTIPHRMKNTKTGLDEGWCDHCFCSWYARPAASHSIPLTQEARP